jgi:hypothetical protein
MPDSNSQRMRNQNINNLKRWFSIASVILVAGIMLIFRNQIVGYLAYSFSYLVWSLNLFGRIIPPQGVWIALVILILYVAVGSFYGKSSKAESSLMEADPVPGPVEAMAEWIDERRRGVYFKWRIAHLLGRVHQSHYQNTSGRVQAAPPEIEAYLDAGLNKSYVDFPTPSVFKKNQPTVLDIELEPVLDYLEDQMEIRR